MTKAWLLPAVVDPVETVCVQIQVPKDDAHIQAFFGALQALGMWWNWERDDSKTALDTSIVWQRQIELAGQAIRDEENCMVDCTDIEDCLETSTTIIGINVDIDINETNITNNETNITVNETNITTNETNIDVIIEGGIDVNVYPPNPTQEDPDEMCGASFYIANQLDTLIQAIIIDALTLTFQEIVEGLLGIGGFQASWVKLWYDFIVVVGNPDLDDEVTASIDAVAEHLYCNDLDRALVETAIDEDVSITDDAQAAWIGALNSVTDAKLALWAFVGSQDDSNDCSSFACICSDPKVFTPGSPGLTVIDGVEWAPVYWAGEQVVPKQSWITFGITWDSCPITRVDIRVRAVWIGGPTDKRNVSQWYNGDYHDSPPQDVLEDYYIEYGEDIAEDTSGYMTWGARIAWNTGNWELQIEQITLS